MLGLDGLKPMGTNPLLAVGLKASDGDRERLLFYLRSAFCCLGDLEVLGLLLLPILRELAMESLFSKTALNLVLIFSPEGEPRRALSSWPKLLCVCKSAF